jgi:hypothetical protein
MPVVLGGGGGGGGATQSVPGLALTPAFDSSSTRFLNCKTNTENNQRLPGFSNNGDFIELQLTGTNQPIAYYNSSGTLQWSVSGPNFGGSANLLAGICKSGSYIYVAYCQASNGVIYCGRVNSSGTVSNAQSTDTSSNGSFTHMGSCWLGIPQGKSNLYFIHPFNWGFGGPHSINISTGATITTKTDFGSYGGFVTSGMVCTLHANIFNGTSGYYNQLTVRSTGAGANWQQYNSDFTADKFGLGIAKTAGWIGKWLYWDGYGIPSAFNGSQLGYIGSVAYNWSDLDAGYVAILNSIGVNWPNSDW